MSTLYTGVAASGARSPAVQIQEPADTDAANAASVNTALTKIANYIAWVQAHAAIFDDTNTFSAAQTIAALLTLSTSDINLTASAVQKILKSGTGKLQVGTSTANDLELLVGNAVKAVLRASDGVLVANAGVSGTGGTNAPGVAGQGTGTGAGVSGAGGATNGYGVVGTGAGNGDGVHGVGGSTDGWGVSGQGTGNGYGVVGTGAGLGAGVYGQAGASGPGVVAVGSSVRAALKLSPQSAPSTPQDGDIWVETSTNLLKVRINGVTKTVTVT